jgi:hypothetical protein
MNGVQINGREYEWADISAYIGAIPISGFKAVSYKREREKEAMFAKGRKAHSIQSGNETITGSITFTQSQLEALELVAGGNLLAAKIDIVVSYGAELDAASAGAAAITTDVIVGAEFTSYEKGMGQSDKSMEIAMPFIALDIKNV